MAARHKLEDRENRDDLITVTLRSEHKLDKLVAGQDLTHESIKDLSSTTHELLADLGDLMVGVSTSKDIKELKDALQPVVGNTSTANASLSGLVALTENLYSSTKDIRLLLDNVKGDTARLGAVEANLVTLNATTTSIEKTLSAVLESNAILMHEMMDRISSLEKRMDDVVGVSNATQARAAKIKQWFDAYGYRLVLSKNDSGGWNYISTASTKKMFYFGNYDPDPTLVTIVEQARADYGRW